MPLESGADAPAIEAQTETGDLVSPSFDEPTVVYFYPRDDTPGCTIEAKQFDAERPSYDDAGVTVYGVSTDGVESHADFVEKYDLDVTLLADPDGEIAEAFGLDVSRGAAPRTTFVLDDGSVTAVYEGVDPDGHAREVLDDLLDQGVVELE